MRQIQEHKLFRQLFHVAALQTRQFACKSSISNQTDIIGDVAGVKRWNVWKQILGLE